MPDSTERERPSDELNRFYEALGDFCDEDDKLAKLQKAIPIEVSILDVILEVRELRVQVANLSKRIEKLELDNPGRIC